MQASVIKNLFINNMLTAADFDFRYMVFMI